MSNQIKLKNYLLGNEDQPGNTGYLKSDLSNGKVIMLSGKWGSGKTHFWQNVIQKDLDDSKNKIPNHYVSLYGKTSIEEIKNEIFLKVFESVDSLSSEEKTQEVVKGTIKTVSSLAKSISVFGISLDLSKITDKSFEKLENILHDEKLKRTEKYLNSGAIICFDDFERKSKEIDLNDLFGFITQLTLNFKCKVVIILNDEVFEGNEKQTFSNVKEKSVSKFLYYNPTIEELFNSIFDEKYKNLKEYRDVILKNIEDTKQLNARIYIQVLDNLLEWVQERNFSSDNYIRFFIFNNMNFILNHYCYVVKEHKRLNNKGVMLHSRGDKVPSSPEFYILSFRTYIKSELDIFNYTRKIDKKYLNNLEQLIIELKKDEDLKNIIEDIIKNKSLLNSYIFLEVMNEENIIESNNQAECDVLNEISNFIESGIL